MLPALLDDAQTLRREQYFSKLLPNIKELIALLLQVNHHTEGRVQAALV